MWSHLLQILPPTSGSGGAGVLPYLLAVGIPSIITGLIGYFGARFTAAAPLQTALNDAFRSLTVELQTQHAQLVARISELEVERDQLRGDNRGLRQLMDSLIRFAEASALALPADIRENVRRHTHPRRGER